MSLSSDIRVAFEAEIQTLLPDYSPLDNKFDLDKNNFINQDKKFGVRLLDGSRADTSPLRLVTIDRNYEVILVQKHIQTINSDTSQQAAVDELEDAMQTIYETAIGNKLGIPANISFVDVSFIDEPNFDIENVTVLRGTFIVKYRSPITQGC